MTFTVRSLSLPLLLAVVSSVRGQFQQGGGQFQQGGFTGGQFPQFPGSQFQGGQGGQFQGGQFQGGQFQGGQFPQSPGGQFPGGQTNSPFSGAFPSLFGSAFGGQGLGNLPPSGPPQRNLATMRARNTAGDALLLNIMDEESPDSNNPLTNYLLSQLGLPPQQSLLGQQGLTPAQRQLIVRGVFLKAQATTGIANLDSLNGNFAIVVTNFGNTDGYCAGTGGPLQVPNRQIPQGANPMNPFTMLLQQLQGPQVVRVSTPLQATTITSTVEGRLPPGVTLNDIVGRAMAVCGDPGCSKPTNLCGTIARDGNTIEEFARISAATSSTTAAAAGSALLGGTPAPTSGGLF